MESSKHIDLNRKQQRLFNTALSHVLLTDIDCNKPMDPIAMHGKNILERSRTPSVTDYSFGWDVRKFYRDVDLFVPVAHAVLMAELGELLINPQKLNEDDL